MPSRFVGFRLTLVLLAWLIGRRSRGSDSDRPEALLRREIGQDAPPERRRHRSAGARGRATPLPRAGQGRTRRPSQTRRSAANRHNSGMRGTESRQVRRRSTGSGSSPPAWPAFRPRLQRHLQTRCIIRLRHPCLHERHAGPGRSALTLRPPAQSEIPLIGCQKPIGTSVHGDFQDHLHQWDRAASPARGTLTSVHTVQSVFRRRAISPTLAGTRARCSGRARTASVWQCERYRQQQPGLHPEDRKPGAGRAPVAAECREDDLCLVSSHVIGNMGRGKFLKMVALPLRPGNAIDRHAAGGILAASPSRLFCKTMYRCPDIRFDAYFRSLAGRDNSVCWPRRIRGSRPRPSWRRQQGL
jgi:hypothetical protein